MRLYRVTRLGRERVHRQRHGARVGRVDDRDLADPLDPPCHRGVLGLGRLDGQPGQADPAALLQDVPYGLGFSRSGGPGDERVPVQGRQRHPERADRPVLRVEDRAGLDRRRPGPQRIPHLGLAGDVEVAGIEYPQSRDLPAGQAGERGERPGRGGERRGGAVGRILHLDRDRLGQRVGLKAAAQPVGVPAQIYRPDQHRSDQPQLLGSGRAGQDAHAPQPGLAEHVEFGHPALRPLDVEPRMLLLEPAEHVELRPQLGDLGVDQPGGLGDDQPAEPPAHERHERRFEQARPPVLLAVCRPGGLGQRRRLAARAGRPDHAVELVAPVIADLLAARADGEQQAGPLAGARRTMPARRAASRPVSGHAGRLAGAPCTRPASRAAF